MSFYRKEKKTEKRKKRISLPDIRIVRIAASAPKAQHRVMRAIARSPRLRETRAKSAITREARAAWFPALSDKRAAFRTLRRASLTAEAAIALPLFLFCATALISLMDGYEQYVRTAVRLQQEAEQLGMLAAAKNDLADPVIELTETVCVTPVGWPYSPLSLQVPCRASVRAWVGNRDGDTEQADGTGRTLVYVSEYQSVYHTTSRCSHLSLHIERVAAAAVGRRRNTSGEKYQPCEKCVGKGAAAAMLYITEDGSRYHNSAECSGLKRTVRLTELDALSGLRECSRCQALESSS